MCLGFILTALPWLKCQIFKKQNLKIGWFSSSGSKFCYGSGTKIFAARGPINKDKHSAVEPSKQPRNMLEIWGDQEEPGKAQPQLVCLLLCNCPYLRKPAWLIITTMSCCCWGNLFPGKDELIQEVIKEMKVLWPSSTSFAPPTG